MQRMPLLPLQLGVLLLLLACGESRSINQSTVVPKTTEQQAGRVLEFRDQVIIKHRPQAPEYPESAKRAGIHGDVKLVIQLNRKGQILDIQTESGPIELVPYAKAYARQFEFDVDPAIPDGLNQVPFRLTIRFSESLDRCPKTNHG